jgi:hypothetical protein
MKTLKLLLLLLPFIVFLGCTKENTVTRVERYVAQQISLNLSAIQDANGGTIGCVDDPYEPPTMSVAQSGWISGSAAPFGKVIQTQSPYTINACSFDEFTKELTLHFSGFLTNNKGEMLHYTGTYIIDWTDGSLTGTIQYHGGSGDFNNCYGDANVKGNLDFTTGVISWTGSATIYIEET